MTYEEIKEALREADRCVQDDAIKLADSMIRTVIAEGGTVQDVNENISEDSLRRLRGWSKWRKALNK
jgi:hypothetical protein